MRFLCLVIVAFFCTLNMSAQKVTYKKDDYYEGRTNIIDEGGKKIGYIENDSYYDKVNHYDANGNIIGSWEKDQYNEDLHYYENPYSTKTNRRGGGKTTYKPSGKLAEFNPGVESKFYGADEYSKTIDKFLAMQQVEIQKNYKDGNRIKDINELEEELYFRLEFASGDYQVTEVLLDLEQFYKKSIPVLKRIYDKHGKGENIGEWKEKLRTIQKTQRIRSNNATNYGAGNLSTKENRIIKRGRLKVTEKSPLLNTKNNSDYGASVHNDCVEVVKIEGDYAKVKQDGKYYYLHKMWYKDGDCNVAISKISTNNKSVGNSSANYGATKSYVTEKTIIGRQKVIEKSPLLNTKNTSDYGASVNNDCVEVVSREGDYSLVKQDGKYYYLHKMWYKAGGCSVIKEAKKSTTVNKVTKSAIVEKEVIKSNPSQNEVIRSNAKYSYPDKSFIVQFVALTNSNESFNHLEYLGEIFSEKVSNKNLYRYKVICSDANYAIRELERHGYKGAFVSK